MLKRRRFLTLMGSATLLPVAAQAHQARWHGTALGARASMVLAGISDAEAAPLFGAIEAELERLEMIFSLYRPNSQISQLNKAGHLKIPAPELLEVLSLAGSLHHATQGKFDPTVQPLWHARATALAAGRSLTVEEIATLQAQTGWTKLVIDASEIRFLRHGMALTLNGIAQGYITDRLGVKLRQLGLRNVLVDMGEIAAFGAKSPGQPWRAGIADPGGVIVKRLALSDRALATSAPGAASGPGVRGHILDPQTGQVGAAGLISVSAPSAMLADGLSTGLSLMQQGEMTDVLTRYPMASLEISV